MYYKGELVIDKPFNLGRSWALGIDCRKSNSDEGSSEGSDEDSGWGVLAMPVRDGDLQTDLHTN